MNPSTPIDVAIGIAAILIALFVIALSQPIVDDIGVLPDDGLDDCADTEEGEQ